MKDEKLVIKGNKDGINIYAKMDNFFGFEDFTEYIISFLKDKKSFYKGSIVIISSDFKKFSNEEIIILKDKLLSEIELKDCIFEEISEHKIEKKFFSGINEGKTKFVKNTLRGGQFIEFDGNVVVIGDVNYGAEINASGNIIVLGSIKGRIRAGISGNREAIVAAFNLQPQLLQIDDIVTFSPEDTKPTYPEIAKIINGNIVVEPYLLNKYIYY